MEDNDNIGDFTISNENLDIKIKRLRGDSISHNLYTEFFLRNTFTCIYEFEDLINEYRQESGKDYEGGNNDQLMISLIKKNNKLKQFYFTFVFVKNTLLPYVKIRSDICNEILTIDYNLYKIDLIKKILSTINDFSTIISLIEIVVFQEVEKGIKTEEEYNKLMIDI